MKQSNRLGCFSFSAIVTALITLSAIVGTTLARGNGMFSAGALNAQTGAALGGFSSHAEIGGDCGLCHTAPWDSATLADRCADCHASVRTELADPASLHGAILTRTPDEKCTDCHTEHKGESNPLTRVEQDMPFPHETLGYSLNGHRLTVTREPFDCSHCHQQDLSNFESATCVDCHRNLDLAFTQAHVLSWGNDCLACHDGVDTYNRHFDHGEVPFTLIGAHVEVDCYTCHTDARSLVDLQSTPRNCVSCHRADEPHEGRFGSDCAKCHTMDAWTPALFDHNLAAFKLEGKHVNVACEECHTSDSQSDTPMECVACHANDDEHAGTFGTECDLCHKPTGWDDDPFDHNKSKFPLIGGHLGVTCESCHKDGKFTDTPISCVACHGYPGWHGSAFGANCLDCHSVNTWYRVTQGIGHPWWRHPEGEVGMGSCRSCHPVSVYDSDCSSCHGRGGFD